MSTYRIEWGYLSELPGTVSRLPDDREAHCTFLIRFLDVPPGDGHCAFLCVNVVSTAGAAHFGVPLAGKRAYIVADQLSKAKFQEQVEADVHAAFKDRERAEALRLLDRVYVVGHQDFSAEFACDVVGVEALRALIRETFAGVARGGGTTLHEALAIDDYASTEEQHAARAKDLDQHWSEVPAAPMEAHPEFLTFLNDEGLRYYLPAAMLYSLNPDYAGTDTAQRTYWRLFRVIAPRDQGKGHGERFDVAAYAARLRLTREQIVAVYRFACFRAVEGGEGVDEDQLPALRKWRALAFD